MQNSRLYCLVCPQKKAHLILLHLFVLFASNTFFFLNDLFLYLAIVTVFYPSGIFKMAWKFLQNFMFKDGVIT